MRRVLVVGLASLVASTTLVFAVPESASAAFVETKLTASDGVVGGFFGSAVAASEDRIVVGAFGDRDDDQGLRRGAVYVYEPDGSGGWAETKLTASDGGAEDSFGSAVAVAGDRIVVGAPNDGAGSVYVYDWNGSGGWSETKLTASDGEEEDQFATAVAVAGDRIVVGAFGDRDDDQGLRRGAVYVYEPDGSGGWAETKLTASDDGGVFGGEVGVSGDGIVVGAEGNDDNGQSSGAVYVYEPDGSGGWAETKLIASDNAAGDSFGGAVGVSGDRIVVGAFGNDDNGSRSGSAYVYDPDGSGGWAETKLTASDGFNGDLFGLAVGVAGDRIVVGAGSDDDNGLSSGSVYVYEPDLPVLTPGNANVVEGDDGTVTLNVPITLSSAAAGQVTVDYTTIDPAESGWATAGEDYVAASGTLTFAPGETAKSVPLTVNGDLIDEPPLFGGEWIAVSFSNPSPNAELDPAFFGLGIGIVFDDDDPPVITPGAQGVVEGDTGTTVVEVPVTLSNPSAQTVTVDWATFDTGGEDGIATAGEDFEAASGTVTFDPGETAQTVEITVNGDLIDEPPLLFGEWVIVQFSNPSPNVTLDQSVFGWGIGIIVDDD